MTSARRLAIAGALALLAITAVAPASAQTRPAYFDQPSTIEQVGRIAPGTRAPLLVLFSPVSSPSRASLPPALERSVPVPGFFVMRTPGVPSTSDFLPSFNSYVGWMEERVLADLERALREHPVDPERVYLVGFSLGGDTAWALLARQAARFRGAMVMGTRASASLRSSAIESLTTRGARLAFVIGTADESRRRDGIRRAFERARDAHIASELFEFGGSHQIPDESTYVRAISFMLDAAPH
ncbi:hypothetical protein [Sandaracinus amylolyticus]|uniref:hypothetical protein n=1 Tax=Sandaracinus amylolyticus TaxID=927083 RepID=UPI001F32EF93|nr:hypothetical protein [Sandaracinus amylolyticus]UJR82564.1 Hypothetical protein I5071_46290 [Sandaracinus amylolyticus]